MVPLQILRIAALSAFLFTSVSAHCETPKVRKEWRRLCREERAAWIKAVNVYVPPAFSRPYSTFQLQCIANLPHDPDFYTTVDSAISLIPPVAQNSSRWDGGMLDTYILLLLTQIEQILCTLTWTSTFW